MNIFEYIKSLFKRLLLKLIKTKQIDISKQSIPIEIDDKLFDDKQKKVITECARLGLDVNVIAKKKYSAEQMSVLVYGMLLGLDTKSFESYTMSPLEMEYTMYQEAINKFLGRDYLLHLLNESNGSIADDYIKRKIDKDLEKELASVYEVAPTLLEEHSNERTEEDDFYDILLQMCEDRNIDASRLEKSSINVMTYEYEKLEKELVNKIDNKCTTIKRLENCTLKPSLLSILKDNSIEDRVMPVKLFINDKLITEYYRIYDGIHIYLYRKGFLTIKIR